MNTAKLIRRKTTADRGIVHVSTEEVLICIKSLKAAEFSTCEIVDALQGAHQHTGRRVLEYAVRTAVAWLMERSDVEVAGFTHRYSKRCKYPYRVTIYRVVTKEAPIDFSVLYRAFGLPG